MLNRLLFPKFLKGGGQSAFWGGLDSLPPLSSYVYNYRSIMYFLSKTSIFAEKDYITFLKRTIDASNISFSRTRTRSCERLGQQLCQSNDKREIPRDWNAEISEHARKDEVKCEKGTTCVKLFPYVSSRKSGGWEL
jgi:hypothetical protein